MWRAANREKIKEQKRTYWAANRETINEQTRMRWAANREKINEQQRLRYAKKREKVREYKRRKTEVNISGNANTISERVAPSPARPAKFCLSTHQTDYVRK